MGSRRSAVDRLRLRPGERVLEVSAGTGTNLPLLSDAIGGKGRLAGIDISRAMLRRCDDKLHKRRLRANLVEAEAAHLPFTDGSFDAVFHHGGIAEFGDTQGAMDEMVRVARPGARVVVCDVGVPTDRKLPFLSLFLLRLQRVYDKPPPIDLVPSDARDVQLSWYSGNAWYAIEFVKPQG
jgi:ubiquinone/menaquinone biosynthesis C-methylase UbiE